MKKLYFLLLLLSACSRQGGDGDGVQVLNAKDFNDRIEANAVLLDVRTPEEFTSGHIPDAINLDYKSANFSDRLDSLDKSKDYMVYCLSGVRSGKAADLMKEKGFNSITTLDGGMEAWVAEGLPVQHN
jgi:phage shock protein E